jgi:hypothetical protein
VPPCGPAPPPAPHIVIFTVDEIVGVIVHVPVEDKVNGPSITVFHEDFPLTAGDIVNVNPYALGHALFCIAIL